MRAVSSFTVTGLEQLKGQQAALRGFHKAAGRSLQKVMRAVVVPELKRAAPKGVKHRGAPGKRGRTGPVARNITVRMVRKRSGEFAAYSAGPHAWYAHFGIGGTKAHVIRAGLKRGMRNRQGQYTPDTGNVSSRGSRRINRSGKVPALSVNGRFYAAVRVKGVKPNDWVTRAAAGKAQQALAILAHDTLPRKDGHGLQGG